ncbi:ABC transporter substrate-binding protein [Cyanobium sp. ATX 6F1]|uniref:ABC transporter substrate-binding protein n=1 Tax=unclassified Cyanobium TaxID=2627006 RepID=UPI0020CEE42E|nr:ABC transporter substrate-binding protein [Cyanobium sp. ATX 6F1]MCP9916000.1 carbohydrate ABC transporter substrate-binding protein [Cyanobium sp. ATX 6F1]
MNAPRQIQLSRFTRAMAALVVPLALAACSAPNSPGSGELAGTVYLYIGLSSGNQTKQGPDGHLRSQLGQFIKDFRLIHPKVGVQLLFFPETQVQAEVTRRDRTGLGPDLMLVNGSSALAMHSAGMTRTVQLPQAVSSQVEPTMLRGFRTKGGWAALPVFSQPQVACYDRKVLKKAPQTLEELLKVSARGIPIGLSLEPVDLYWSAGGLGATTALQRLLAPEKTSVTPAKLLPADRAGLLRWLSWLDQASDQQRVTFYGSTDDLLGALVKGDLAWIACRSRHLARLQREMGPRLGVAPLPSGPEGQASPIARLRVWAFGRDSSPEQRRISQALAEFSVNPLVQRAATLSSDDALPVNRYVNVPVTSSRVLAALEKGMAQSQAYDLFNVNLIEGDPREALLREVLTSMIFGAADGPQAIEMLTQRLAQRP